MVIVCGGGAEFLSFLLGIRCIMSWSQMHGMDVQ